MLDRAYATLAGLAIGDALGMPTQSLSREDIVKDFAGWVDDFLPASPTHPFAAGLARATVTDDTEQALILAQLLVESPGSFDARTYVRRLLAWEESVRARGLLDLLGPSTKQALANIENGMDLSQSGRSGTTNGAAMRVAPVGIVSASADLEALVARVVEVSAPTHNTSSAISAAAAVAAVVSAGIDGASIVGAIATGIRAARMGEHFGAPSEGARVADQIVKAVALGRVLKGTALIDAVNDEIGTSLAANASVPAAFALLAAHAGDAWGACCVAASLGGDCDTIGAITGAMAGACAGIGSFPSWAVSLVETTNSLALAKVARELIAVRR
jgi:ADP-ribosylglycohydrolase